MPPLLATIYSYTGEGTDQDVQATIVAEGINQGTVTVRELLRATHVDAARRAQHWEGRLSPRRWCVFDQTNYPSTRRRYNRSLGDTDARGPCRTLGSTCQPKTDSSALESHFWWWPRSMFAVVDAAAPMPPGGRTRLYGTTSEKCSKQHSQATRRGTTTTTTPSRMRPPPPPPSTATPSPQKAIVCCPRKTNTRPINMHLETSPVHVADHGRFSEGTECSYSGGPDGGT